MVAKNPDLFLRPLNRMVREQVWDVFMPDLKILPAQLVDQVGVYAPLALILDTMNLEPEELIQ
jgi:hypothetical protein